MYVQGIHNKSLSAQSKMDAVKLVRQCWSTRKVAKYTGFNQSTIVRWKNRAPRNGNGLIPTLSSRPWHHPREASEELVQKILEYRKRYHRCAEVLHYLLLK